MKNLLASTAIALVAVAGFAVPVFADEDTDSAFNETTVINSLQAKGVDAVDVEKWGDRVIADVLLADGSTERQVFDLNTYQPVGSNNGNTRVLTEVDAGFEVNAVPESIFNDDND
jgi:hypothetical protein